VKTEKKYRNDRVPF